LRFVERGRRGQAVHTPQASEATPSSTATGEQNNAVFDDIAVQDRRRAVYITVRSSN